MSPEPERIIDSRRSQDRALASDLRAFQRALPAPHEIDAVLWRLWQTTSEEYLDSGIRVSPLQHAERTPPLRAKTRVEKRALSLAIIPTLTSIALTAAGYSLIWRTTHQAPEQPVALSALPEMRPVDRSPVPEATPPEVRPGPGGGPAAALESTAPRETPSVPARANVEHSRPRFEARESLAAPEMAIEPSTPGLLNINSIPLSHVVLDGRPLGGTPRVQVEVQPGLHTVLFVHPEHGRKFFDVYVGPGQTVLAAVRFR